MQLGLSHISITELLPHSVIVPLSLSYVPLLLCLPSLQILQANLEIQDLLFLPEIKTHFTVK